MRKIIIIVSLFIIILSCKKEEYKNFISFEFSSNEHLNDYAIEVPIDITHVYRVNGLTDTLICFSLNYYHDDHRYNPSWFINIEMFKNNFKNNTTYHPTGYLDNNWIHYATKKYWKNGFENTKYYSFFSDTDKYNGSYHITKNGNVYKIDFDNLILTQRDSTIVNIDGEVEVKESNVVYFSSSK